MSNICKYCNKVKNGEQMIVCASCKGHCHPSCLELPEHIVPAVLKYDWQCNDCKYCYQCHNIQKENRILFCDACDRGYHMFCLVPKLKRKPKGDWYCPYCHPANQKEKQSEKQSESSDEGYIRKDNESKSGPSKQQTAKSCQFPGCDGSGSIRSNSSFHYSTSLCPLFREEKRKEKAALKRKNSECDDLCDDVPLSAMAQSLSSADIDMYQKARKKAEVLELDQEMAPSPDGIKYIQFGNVEIEVWYKSQYPLEYSKIPKLFVCEFCLQYFKTDIIYSRHMSKCTMRHPPGDEIYRKDNLSVFEINGETATLYCQNLCLVAKLFLDHKTLWSDVGPFLFYVMTFADDKGCHIIGYFSKEKNSFLNYNVSCILVLPHHMKKGYGQLMIDFSYLLSQEEHKIGSPERPLSDLGLISYRKFWGDKLLQYLVAYKDDQITIKGISEKMAINVNDVVSTLQYLGMLKYWKGKHLILLKEEILQEYASKVQNRGDDFKSIDASCLKWTPKPTKDAKTS